MALTLTLLENWLEQKGGVAPYQGGFLLHHMDKLVYPDVSATALTVAGLIVCSFNLTLYGRQAWRIKKKDRSNSRSFHSLTVAL